MRKCLRCGEEMVENGYLVTGDKLAPYVTIKGGSKTYDGQRPKVAVCPKCGELSLYVEADPKEGYFF